MSTRTKPLTVRMLADLYVVRELGRPPDPDVVRNLAGRRVTEAKMEEILSAIANKKNRMLETTRKSLIQKGVLPGGPVE